MRRWVLLSLIAAGCAPKAVEPAIGDTGEVAAETGGGETGEAGGETSDETGGDDTGDTGDAPGPRSPARTA